jgi:hypothetical protein
MQTNNPTPNDNAIMAIHDNVGHDGVLHGHYDGDINNVYDFDDGYEEEEDDDDHTCTVIFGVSYNGFDEGYAGDNTEDECDVEDYDDYYFEDYDEEDPCYACDVEDYPEDFDYAEDFELFYDSYGWMIHQHHHHYQQEQQQGGSFIVNENDWIDNWSTI